MIWAIILWSWLGGSIGFLVILFFLMAGVDDWDAENTVFLMMKTCFLWPLWLVFWFVYAVRAVIRRIRQIWKGEYL